MYLRKLELKDAPLMLEWMHDDNVTNQLYTDFATKTIADAEDFIKSSWNDKHNIHLAISSYEDVYMGTVSLKNIKNQSAEFAITVRSCSMGKGYAWFAMQNIIDKGFSDYKLKRIYWCVSKDNVRAIRFYEKHKFQEIFNIPKEILFRYDGLENLKWYEVENN